MIAILLKVTLLMAMAQPTSSEPHAAASAQPRPKTELVPFSAEDPFRPWGESAVMKTGRDKGEAIDVDWRRSGVELTPEQAKQYFPDFDPTKEIALANVKHFDEFYVARIPLEGLQGVKMNRYRILEKLPVSHGGLRFVMKKGYKIRLVPQKKGSTSPRLEFDSLGFGIYAVGKKGRTFGAENSRNQDLVSAYLFYTPAELMERYKKDVIKQDMKEISLDQMQPADTQALLKHLVKTATSTKYEEVYGMFINNCVHRLLALIRESQIPKSKPARNALIRKGVKSVVNPVGSLLESARDASGNLLPTGLANGFSPVIQHELYRIGVTSYFSGWSDVLKDPELKSLQQK